MGTMLNSCARATRSSQITLRTCWQLDRLRWGQRWPLWAQRM